VIPSYASGASTNELVGSGEQGDGYLLQLLNGQYITSSGPGSLRAGVRSHLESEV